jgi:hypothetical protein
MKTHHRVHAFLLLIITVATAFGCGGGRPSNGRGAIRVTILWPADSRVIPPETRSIRLKAQVLEPDDGQVTNDVVVPRPEGQAVSNTTIEDVPSVKVRVIASAHSSMDGTGPILAQGSREVRVLENGNVPVDIELQGSVVTPQPLTVTPPKAFAQIGQTVTFVASEANVTWTASGGSITNSGAFSSDSAGTFTVTATSVPPGRTGSASVLVGDLPGFMLAQVPIANGVPEGSLTSFGVARPGFHRFRRVGTQVQLDLFGTDSNGAIVQTVSALVVTNMTDDSFDLGPGNATSVAYDAQLGGSLSVSLVDGSGNVVHAYTTPLRPLFDP